MMRWNASDSLDDLGELLVELIDALAVPTFDNGDFEGHLEQIDAIMAAAPERLRKTLKSARAQLDSDARRNWFDFLDDQGGVKRLQVISELRSKMESGGYLYHGTTSGNLERISEHGLDPSVKRVWKDEQADRRNLKDAVFFEATWRGATDWALAAAARARGPKRSRSRERVVLRVPRAELEVFKDPLSAKPGSVWVRGPVLVRSADVLTEPFSGFPDWNPLTKFLSRSH
ncbi:MAG: hypothetical protein ABJO97_00585 [Roseibium sp.]|uniref:hypothetical protein n=2 Tax=Roseibium sp. TaxID=1936156 RepID=UPI0032635ED7